MTGGLIASWWSGTRLVAGRALAEQVRSRTFKVVTVILLLVSAATVTIPQIIDEGETTHTLATVGPAPPDLAAALEAAGEVADFRVRFVVRSDEDAVREAVREGEATAGLAGDTLYVAEDAGSTFPVAVSQAVVGLETNRRLTELGLTPAQIDELRTVEPPRQVAVGEIDDEERAGVGWAVGLVLYLALMFAGSSIATTVGVEKSTRISEVLLSVLRPSQVLTGTVVAIGAVTLLQMLILAVPVVTAIQVSDGLGLPSDAAVDVVLAVVWFLLGFVLFSFVFAATASLVDKVTEVSSAITPVTITLVAGYLLSVAVVGPNPDSPWSVAASMFPLTAPLAMPIRWGTGEVPGWQLALSMALTAIAAVLLVRVASTVYRRALVITGRRVKLPELIGRPAA